jgi:hypothetical protein
MPRRTLKTQTLNVSSRVIRCASCGRKQLRKEKGGDYCRYCLRPVNVAMSVEFATYRAHVRATRKGKVLGSMHGPALASAFELHGGAEAQKRERQRRIEVYASQTKLDYTDPRLFVQEG